MDRYLINTSSSAMQSKNNSANRASTSTSTKRKLMISETDNSLPVCMLCSVTLSNESMVPSKLKRHFEKNHPDYTSKPKSYFENLHSQIKNQAKRLKNYCTIPQKAQLASYKIAQLLAMKKKPHTDAENIILPAMEIALEAMVNTKAIEQVRLIPLSADTIARKIQDMSDDIDLQLKEHFMDNSELSKLWALQIDESTDISNKAQLLAYIRIVINGSIQNHFFSVRS